jgi:HTH-type transcriptional regulator, competence development regulator
MESETFGEFVRRVRESAGLPLRKLAAALDIDQSTLSKIERNERQLTADLLEPLSKALNLDYKKTRVKFLSDKITSELYPEPDSLEVLKVAEKKIKYLKAHQ